MGQGQDNFKRGTAEMLLLFLLSKEEMYGYQLMNVLSERSEGRYNILEGTISLLMLKSEEAGFVKSKSVTVGKRRIRKYYSLTEKGEERLQKLLDEYKDTVFGIQMILGSGGEDGE